MVQGVLELPRPRLNFYVSAGWLIVDLSRHLYIPWYVTLPFLLPYPVARIGLGRKFVNRLSVMLEVIFGDALCWSTIANTFVTVQQARRAAILKNSLNRITIDLLSYTRRAIQLQKSREFQDGRASKTSCTCSLLFSLGTTRPSVRFQLRPVSSSMRGLQIRQSLRRGDTWTIRR